MRELHPEIRKYWEALGTITSEKSFECTTYRFNDTLIAVCYEDKKHWNGYYLTIADDEITKTEEEILRLIKLKAFL